MTSIWGFGGVKFQKSGNTATFYDTTSTGVGTISYEPVYIRKTNIDNKIISRLLGYRAEIEVELTNIKSGDYAEFQTLLGMLNDCISSTAQETIEVTPRYADIEADLSFTCILDSDITMKDLHRLEIGQTLKLKFIAIDLETYVSQLAGTGSQDTYTFIVNDEGTDKDLEYLNASDEPYDGQSQER